MRVLQTLLDREDRAGGERVLPPQLAELYDGDLRFPALPGAAPDAVTHAAAGAPPAARPYVLANFVSTLDGAASFKAPGQSSGSTVSGSDRADRFIMGLLRASVDAVLVGATTVHDTGARARWIPADTYPDAEALFRDYRLNVLHTRENPLVAIVTGSGKLDLQRAVFRSAGVRTLVITTAAGVEELNRRGVREIPSLEVKALTAEGVISPVTIFEMLGSQFGVRRLLHEGGPTLFGEFLAAGAVDEFFLTLSPQIAGRTPRTIRPGIVEGVEFTPEMAPWFDLLSVKQSGQHMYLRYRRAERRDA